MFFILWQAVQTYVGFVFSLPICNLASKANVDTTLPKVACKSCPFHLFTFFASRASVYTLSQIQLANSFPFSPFTIFASRASGYPLLQKPHFQIMPIYNSFIIFLVGFLPLVGEFLPQTPNKNRRENLKNLLSELRPLGLTMTLQTTHKICILCVYMLYKHLNLTINM